MDWDLYGREAQACYDEMGMIPIIVPIEGDELTQVVSGLLLQAIRSGHPTATLLIRSDGGEVQTGAAIADAVRMARARGLWVIGRVSGRANSAAAMILLACSHRQMAPDARMMVHFGRTTLFNEDLAGIMRGEEWPLQQIKGRLDTLISAITTRSNMSPEAVQDLLSRDQFLSAPEALERDLIDEVLPWEPTTETPTSA